MSEKNDNTVVPFAKPAAKSVNDNETGATENEHPTHKFNFTVLADEDGVEEVCTYQGYLACTSSFVGIADENGDLMAVFPLDILKHVRRVEVEDETTPF